METRMSGLFDDYREMFKTIMNWNTDDSDPRYYSKGTHPVLGNEDGHYLYSAGYSLGDAGWFGWSGERLRNEHKIYDKINIAYSYLLKSLAEAIGYEFPQDQDVWKYYLSKIDTDDLFSIGFKK